MNTIVQDNDIVKDSSALGGGGVKKMENRSFSILIAVKTAASAWF